MLLGTRDLQLQPALSPVTALDRDLAPLSCEEKLVVVREQLAEVGGYFYKSLISTNLYSLNYLQVSRVERDIEQLRSTIADKYGEMLADNMQSCVHQ